MKRVQLAISSTVSTFVWGPAGVGKSDVLRAIFSGRLRHYGVANIDAKIFLIDCSVVDQSLVDGMLEVFQSRLVQSTSPPDNLLALEHIDLADEGVANSLSQWLTRHDSLCCVAASSRLSLDELRQRGGWWHDLSARMGTIEVHLPPLAHRREDIPALLQHALAQASSRAHRPPPQLSQSAMNLLMAYDWPENVAELQRAAADIMPLIVITGTVQPNHLPLAIRTFGGTASGGGASSVEPVNLDEILTEIERIVIGRALKLSPRNRAQAARWLGISRPRLLRRISELGLEEPPKFKEEPENNETCS